MVRFAYPAMGTAFGKYSIVRELGRGSMGVVYLAEDQSLGRQVALKVLTPSLSTDEDFKSRFRLEARSIASLNHPHVVRVHNLDEIDGLLTIDMEFVAGGDLFAHLSRGMSYSEIVHVGAQVLDALDACHQRDVIHRDVKPTNILLDAHGLAKVADFGLAKMLESQMNASYVSLRTSGYFLGTPRYAPPEAWDAAEPDPAWDIYSLGVVLYEALSGRPPYKSNTPMSLVKEMVEKDVAPLRTAVPEISAPLADLVDSMISKQRDRRPQSALEALNRLTATSEYAQGSSAGSATVLAPRPRQPRRKPHWPRKFLKVLPALAALVVLALVITAYAVTRSAPGAETPPEPAAEQMVLQQNAFASAILPAETIAELAKSPAAEWRVYTAVLTSGDVTQSGSALRYNNASGADSIVLLSPEWLCVLKTSRDQGRLAVDGSWGQLAGPAGSVLRLGRLDGLLQIVDEERLVAGTLQLADERLNDHWQAHLQLSATGHPITDTEVLLTFERERSLPALLYNELLPRRLDWAMEFERRLPALAEARIDAVDIGAAELEIDGRLHEPFWLMRSLAAGESRAIPGIPRNQRANLLVRRSGTRLLLGVTIPDWTSGPARLELAAQTAFAVPTESSPRWLILHDSATDTHVIQNLLSGAVGAPDDFECALDRSQAGLTAEIAVDLGALSPDEPLSRVRLNLQVKASDDEAAVPEVIWGWPILTATEHGALIVIPETE
ncbi:MAG: hypothetical protein AMXMBFR82_26320 [Candidatus Hydrogenedentota bacterium]